MWCGDRVCHHNCTKGCENNKYTYTNESFRFMAGGNQHLSTNHWQSANRKNQTGNASRSALLLAQY